MIETSRRAEREGRLRSSFSRRLAGSHSTKLIIRQRGRRHLIAGNRSRARSCFSSSRRAPRVQAMASWSMATLTIWFISFCDRPFFVFILLVMSQCFDEEKRRIKLETENAIPASRVCLRPLSSGKEGEKAFLRRKCFFSSRLCLHLLTLPFSSPLKASFLPPPLFFFFSKQQWPSPSAPRPAPCSPWPPPPPRPRSPSSRPPRCEEEGRRAQRGPGRGGGRMRRKKSKFRKSQRLDSRSPCFLPLLSLSRPLLLSLTLTIINLLRPAPRAQLSHNSNRPPPSSS